MEPGWASSYRPAFLRGPQQGPEHFMGAEVGLDLVRAGGSDNEVAAFVLLDVAFGCEMTHASGLEKRVRVAGDLHLNVAGDGLCDKGPQHVG